MGRSWSDVSFFIDLILKAGWRILNLDILHIWLVITYGENLVQ